MRHLYRNSRLSLHRINDLQKGKTAESVSRVQIGLVIKPLTAGRMKLGISVGRVHQDVGVDYEH